jgi:hypothetical protein
MNHVTLPLFVFSVLLAPIAAQKVALKQTAKQGTAAAFVVKNNVNQAIDLGGQQMDMGQNMTHHFTVMVATVAADGTCTVDLNISRIVGSMEMPMMGSIDFDTNPPAAGKDGKEAKEEEPEDGGMGGMGLPSGASIRTALLSFVGKTFTAKMDPHGKVQEVTGVAEALEQAKSKGGGSMMISNIMDKDAVLQLVEYAFGDLPKDDKAVGESWTGTETKKRKGMPMKSLTTMTLNKFDGEVAEVAIVGTIASASGPSKLDAAKPDAAKPDAAKPDAAKPENQTEGDDDDDDETDQARQVMENAKIENGKISGSMLISRKDGLVVRSETKTSMEITAPSPMGGGEMTISVTSTLLVERAKPGEEKPVTTPVPVNKPVKVEPKDAAAKPATPAKAAGGK